MPRACPISSARSRLAFLVKLALVVGETLRLASLAVGAVADDFGEADGLSGG
jgi:hypothetical protein